MSEASTVTNALLQSDKLLSHCRHTAGQTMHEECSIELTSVIID